MKTQSKLSHSLKFLLTTVVFIGAMGVQAADARNCRVKKDSNGNGAAIGAILGALLSADGGGDVGSVVGGALAGAFVGAALDELDVFEQCQIQSIHDRVLNKNYNNVHNRRYGWEGQRHNSFGHVTYINHGYHRQNYCRDYVHEYTVRGRWVTEYGRYCQNRSQRWQNWGVQSHPFQMLNQIQY